MRPTTQPMDTPGMTLLPGGGLRQVWRRQVSMMMTHHHKSTSKITLAKLLVTVQLWIITTVLLSEPLLAGRWQIPTGISVVTHYRPGRGGGLDCHYR